VSYMGTDTINDIRAHIDAQHQARYPKSDQQYFELERKARVLAEILNYLGIQVPEARDVVGGISDLLVRQRHAEQFTPVLRHFL